MIQPFPLLPTQCSPAGSQQLNLHYTTILIEGARHTSHTHTINTYTYCKHICANECIFMVMYTSRTSDNSCLKAMIDWVSFLQEIMKL